MADQPTRHLQPTLAYLLTDVAGSTRLWETDRQGMGQKVVNLDRLMAESVLKHGGALIKSRGEGDSHFAVFPAVEGALSAITEISIALMRMPGLDGIQLRAAVHAGATEYWGGDYYGPAVNRCSRIRQAANPGQVLSSEVVHQLAPSDIGVGFKDLGVHRLRDLLHPERLFQLVHPDLQSKFKPPNTLSNLSHNLPISPTSFIGREAQIQRLTQVLQSNRLVTVSGAGGVGKTRLALQVAAECVERFSDGVWFIDLAQTTRTEGILPIVLSVLDPSVEGTDENLLEAIGSRELLLIVDNCEHLFDECSRLAANLLAHCPNVSILATSRRVLEVRGEYVFRLSGMELPGPEQVDEAFRFDGSRLFLERVEQRGTGVTVNQATLPQIVDLCRKVDGLPLAVEMVASLTDLLSVSDIARSIAEYLEVPIFRGGDDVRQQTMSATIEWSRRLVSPDARQLLTDLTFFPGTWSLDGAQEICLADKSPLHAHELLRELINHSLVFSSRTPHDEVRFGLLQVTREVLVKQAKPSAKLASRFVKFFRKEVERARLLIEIGEEARAHESMEVGWESIVKALNLSFRFDLNACTAIALSLRPFWTRGTRIREGQAWYEKLCGSPKVDPKSRVSLQLALSGLYILAGENELAHAVLLSAQKAVQPIGGHDLALVTGHLALYHDRMGHYEESRKGFEACCGLFNEYGSEAEQALAMLNFGVAKLRLNEPLAESAALYGQALERAEAARSTSMQAKAHSCLAHVDKLEGRFVQSLRQSRDALRLWQQDPLLSECALEMIGLGEALQKIELFESSARVVMIGERLEELSQSPFPARHKKRMSALQETARASVPAADWRAGQRLVKSKTGPELLSMAVALIDDALPYAH